MRGPSFKTLSVDESFFDSAPLLLRDTMEIPLPAPRVWEELTADGALTWCRIIRATAWTSPSPFGIGTTRTVRSLGGLQVFQERFFRWEEGRRQSFYVFEANTPLFRRFAEDYLIEPVSEGACRFSWTIAVEPRPVARPGEPVNRRLLATLFRDTRRHFGAS
jgi:hypothetical protein